MQAARWSALGIRACRVRRDSARAGHRQDFCRTPTLVAKAHLLGVWRLGRHWYRPHHCCWGEKASKLETKLNDLENETQELRARSKLTEDLERSQSELAMIAELQRMENLNEKRALKEELGECNRKHDLLMKQTTQQHTEKIADVKRHFEGELTKILDQHNELVAELEHRIKNERGRYRDLQDRSHQHIQQLEAQVSALQESCDLNALDGGLRRALGNSSGFVEAGPADPLQTPNRGLSMIEK